MKPKLVAQIVVRNGKYFVFVSTPLGMPDVQSPTTFEPDFQENVGPFDSEEEAKVRLSQIEDALRLRGQLWRK